MEDKSPLLDLDWKAPMDPMDPMNAAGVESEPSPYTCHPQQAHTPYHPQQPGYYPQMGQQTSVVTSQPAPLPPMTMMVIRSPSEAADRAIILSIFNMIFCNLLFGIIALIIAMTAKDHIRNGREQEGQNMVRTANIINIVGVALVALAIVIIVIIVIIANSM